jgi:hypothetical protein
MALRLPGNVVALALHGKPMVVVVVVGVGKMLVDVVAVDRGRLVVASPSFPVK